MKRVSSTAGFSIVELMVVVVILSGLAALAMPRLRTFIAQGRQAEAKNLLAQIHTLQATHQNSEDKFTRWDFSNKIGKGGTCDWANAVVDKGTCTGTGCATGNQVKKVDCASTCTWSAVSPGADSLGFKPQACADLRYGYWIAHGVDSAGKEGYLAVAYAPSDSKDRIYPTCNGEKGRTKITLTNSRNSAIKVESTTHNGDWQSVDEDKVWGHNDIIDTCK